MKTNVYYNISTKINLNMIITERTQKKIKRKKKENSKVLCRLILMKG